MDKRPDDLLIVERDVPALQPLSRIQQRLILSAAEIAEADHPESILYQHTVFCQTGLPYRSPGEGQREWERRNGDIRLKVVAGEVLDPQTGEWVKLGLPYGPKPRLVLMYLNREALLHGSPEIEVDGSLTAFAKGLLGYSPNGREVRLLRDQLVRLSSSLIRMGVIRDGRTQQVEAKVVSGFDLWLSRDARQHTLWSSVVTLSSDYFDSLQRHSVPLDPRAIAALSHSCLGLDLYSWLSQRLHRVNPARPAFLPWTALHGQFGQGYGRIRKFREVFRATLALVCTQYQAAKVELDGCGMILRQSPPPVKGRIAVVRSA